MVHTLVAVHTDDGRVGIGSVFTSDGLVNAALDVLCPLLIGETALEPERVVEKLHQNTFWMGRGGSITHTISGDRHRAVGPAGPGDGTAGRPAARRALP